MSPRAAARCVPMVLLPLALIGIAAPSRAVGATATDCAPTEAALPGTRWKTSVANGVPVRASALFSAPEHQVHEAREGRGPDARIALSDGDAARGGPVFAVLSGTEGARNTLSFRLPSGNDPHALRLRLNAIEHLYALVFRQPPQTGFEMPTAAGSPQRASRHALSQPDTLRRLAAWRQCAATRLLQRDPSAALRRWAVPRIASVRPRPDGALRGAARIEVSPALQSGTTLSFARGAHFACSGGVDRSGIGSCTLFDSHGHDDHDHGGGSEPLLITFGGSVEAERIVLPMTAIVPARRATQAKP